MVELAAPTEGEPRREHFVRARLDEHGRAHPLGKQLSGALRSIADNQAELERAIASVVAQSRPCNELIVVDDGSAESVGSIAERMVQEFQVDRDTAVKDVQALFHDLIAGGLILESAR